LKIYFEDKTLDISNAPNDVIPLTLINAKHGPTMCYSLMKEAKEFFCDKTPIYTNSIIALLHAAELAWNKETQHFDIYLRCKNGEWKNIHELTTRELRQGHNIWKLWWAGEFEERQENTK